MSSALTTDDSNRISSFSELYTSDGIKQSAKLIREGLSVGYDEAKEYTEVVNNTVDTFGKCKYF